eukprot:TRINITY_DN33422_c0_g1_i1.p1 TRINITY_DN33422_c0_g1~~TRINITY_DN33422_c0_g1_i1.p1  ORF type:complete len:444 (+),score=57.30 TRINITY_DN33422_c0_g1_i1:28-1332(+)
MDFADGVPEDIPPLQAHIEEPEFSFSVDIGNDVPDQTHTGGASPSKPAAPKSDASSDDEFRTPRPQGSPSVDRQMRTSSLSCQRTTSSMWRTFSVQSAPMLPAVDAAHVKSMYVSRSTSWRPGSDMDRTIASPWHKCPAKHNRQWTPLGSTWRERNMLPDGHPRWPNADDANEFIDGCVPAWGKERVMRTKGALEQKLTWTYYNLRTKKQIGSLRQEGSLVDMEKSQASVFNFWSDLRPPFRIQKVERDKDDDGSHPDGLLHTITYCCPVDYVTERKWNMNSADGTFENTVKGFAEVRIPKDFPAKNMCILSWGNPTLIDRSSKSTKLRRRHAARMTVSPKLWSPIAQELSMRADHPRFAHIRSAIETVKCGAHKEDTGPHPLRKLLFGPSQGVTLQLHEKADAEAREMKSKPRAKKREFGIHTASAGFIRYSG